MPNLLTYIPFQHAQLTTRSGIGLETSILFAKEGANVLMTDISQEALDRALAKVKQLVPDAGRVEAKV
jgi:NAD(P)-dependent dehydrogenase (short-subunit alcohol dehydrogenase family)